MKRGDIRSMTRDDLTAVAWRDKHDVYLLSNMHNAPAEGNFCDDNGNAVKSAIVEDSNQNMGYVDKSNRVTQ